MKRNTELLRNLLFQIETSGPETPDTDIDPGEEHPRTIVYHLKLLEDAGYLTLNWVREGDLELHSPIVPCSSITNAGHDFLDTIRDDTVWKKTREKLALVGGTAALDTVNKVATAISLKLMGLS